MRASQRTIRAGRGGIPASLVAAALLAAVLGGSPARAIDEIATEEAIAEYLAAPSRASDDGQTARRRWAVLPQLGYGPDTGPVVGGKLTNRNVADTGATLDLDATIALEGQYSFDLELGTPHLLGGRLLALVEAGIRDDPQREFFGLGNSDLPGDGVDELSVHEEQRTDVRFTIGWRPWPHVAVNAGVGLRYVSIRRRTRDVAPFTIDRFPNLPGIDGGYVNPLSLSLVWNTRDDVVRPTRGWRGILKVAHTDSAMLSDFDFTRFTVDLGYLLPLFDGAHVLGARLDGGFIMGPRREIPFWELEPLGGNDTLRGFFPRRFLGTSRLLLNTEYRARLTEFDFFDFWHVRLDAAVFGEMGRVFIDNDELEEEFDLDHASVDRVASDFRYSYGGGLRFAVSEAIAARVDVGFSEEEKGLVYLEFGHAF